MVSRETELSTRFPGSYVPQGTRLPVTFVATVLFLTLFPSFLAVIGIDFGQVMRPIYPNEVMGLSVADSQRLLAEAVEGALIYALCNWTGFVLAGLTVILATFHLGYKQSQGTLLLAISLFFGGAFDAFHALVVSGSVTPPFARELLPDSLVSARGAVSLSMAVGLSLSLFPRLWLSKHRFLTLNPWTVAILSLFAVAAFYSLLMSIAPVPRDAFDLGVLTIYVVSSLAVFARLFRRETSMFSHALFLSLLPFCVMEAHFAFGSRELFDSHFSVAQFLKIVGYGVPLTGVCLDYLRNQRTTRLMQQLQTAQIRLLENTRDLEVANRQLAQQVEKRLEFERRLRDSERLKASILNTALDAIVTFDSTGRIRDFNEMAGKMIGFVRTQSVPMVPIGRLLPDRFRARYLRQSHWGLLNVADSLFNRRLQLRLRRLDGREFPAELTMTQIRAGRDSLFTVFIRDITERIRQKRELLGAREEAIRASQAKSEFLANMSHEIRTPLNAIIGMTDLLAEGPLEGDQEKYLRICRRASKTLLNIINDVLDLSKIEAGQLDLEFIDYDFHSVVESVAEMMSIRADEKDLAFTMHIRPDVPRVINGDPNRMRQILLNLAGNAVKFTKEGEVVLRVEVARAGDVETLVISVRDTGIGIPENELDHIFEKFTQADSSITRKHGGTGLGLAICRRLIEAMDGTVAVRSRVGDGSEFRVSVPVVAPWIQVMEEPAQIPLNLQGLRILLVDPLETRRIMLRDHLESWGGSVREIEDANGAVESALQALASRNCFHLVIIGVRRVSYETDILAGRLKQAGSGPCILLTDENAAKRKWYLRTALKESLYSSVISQPVKRSDLAEALALALGKKETELIPVVTSEIVSGGASDERGPIAAIQLDGKSILLVEDSPDNRTLIQAYLKNTSVELVMAENGRMGLDRFRGKTFDLVLMDMQMPVMDGYAATRALREWEYDQGRFRTPILALTAHALNEEIKRSFDAGCDGHLSKPINKQRLLDTIELFIKGANHDDRRDIREGYDGSSVHNDLGGPA